jgi:hypothetical protein
MPRLQTKTRLRCRRPTAASTYNKGEGQLSTLPPLLDRAEAGTMDDRGRSTTDVAPPRSPPVYTMYGCSKNAPDPATLCHFPAPPGRPPGAAAGSVSRYGVMRSGQRRGRPGRPEARWHRCTENCHRGGGLLFTMGSQALAAPPKWRAAAAPEGGCPAARCQAGTLLPPDRASRTMPRDGVSDRTRYAIEHPSAAAGLET